MSKLSESLAQLQERITELISDAKTSEANYRDLEARYDVLESESGDCVVEDHEEALELLRRLFELFSGANSDGAVIDDLRQFGRNQHGWRS